jgi:hypothetical protein
MIGRQAGRPQQHSALRLWLFTLPRADRPVLVSYFLVSLSPSRHLSARGYVGAGGREQPEEIVRDEQRGTSVASWLGSVCGMYMCISSSIISHAVPPAARVSRVRMMVVCVLCWHGVARVWGRVVRVRASWSWRRVVAWSRGGGAARARDRRALRGSVCSVCGPFLCLLNPFWLVLSSRVRFPTTLIYIYMWSICE